MLRLAFRSPRAAPDPLPAVVDEPQEVEFVAYAEDCVLSGRIRLEADRLSDLVNANEQLELVDILVLDLAGGGPIHVHELAITRDEILVVHATGPRGRADRRHPTRQVPIDAKLGPYVVSGYVHVMRGADAISSLRRGRPLVALSDVAIDYFVGDEPEHREVETVLLNWALADSIVEIADEPEAAEPEAAEPEAADDERAPVSILVPLPALDDRRDRRRSTRSAGAA